MITKEDALSSFQMTKSDRVYVNGPGDQQQIESPGGVELLSVTNLDLNTNSGMTNVGMSEDENDEMDDKEENGLTPGDLLAFAWQIARGMVCY